MTTRRSFLGSILAAGMAPAIVKAEILMPVRKIIVQEWTHVPGYAPFDRSRMAKLKEEMLNLAIELKTNPPLVIRHRHWLCEADGQTLTFIDTPMDIKTFQQLRMKGTQ